jgi:hypothetical protein
MSHPPGQRLRGRRAVDRRRRLLQDSPLCVWCKDGTCPHLPGAGIIATTTGYYCVREADVLDHTQPLHLGGKDEPANLQPLCQDCHDLKTAREAHGRAAPGGKPPPTTIGTDGWPASECSSQDVFRQLLLGSLVHGSLYPLPMPRVWHEPPAEARERDVTRRARSQGGCAPRSRGHF